MNVVWVVCLACGALFVCWTGLWLLVARPRRRDRAVEAVQPDRLAQLTREAVAAGFEVVDERNFVAKLPLGGAAITVVDLVWEKETREHFVASAGTLPISAHAHVCIQMMLPALPFELQLYRRDWMMWSRGLERPLSRAFRERYVLHAQDVDHREAVVDWSRRNEARLLALAPERVYLRACHCGRKHGPSAEVILSLSAFTPEAGALERALALISEVAGLRGREGDAPYRRA